jgi:2-C-methyl-D-erythritol 4-phosphate cytidylyltransferase
MVSEDLVRDMFAKAETTPSLIPVIPCVDTMKVLEKTCLEDGSEVLKTVPGAAVDRSVLYGAQTPQIFHSEVLKKAYMQAFDTAFTDDASVVEKDGKNLSYIMGERFNIKITTQDDLILAKAIMSVSGKD